MLKKYLITVFAAVAMSISACATALAADVLTPAIAAEHAANDFEKEWLIYQTSVTYDKAIKIQPVFIFAYQPTLAKNYNKVLSQHVDYNPVDYTLAYSPANYLLLSNRLISHAAYIEHHKQANNVNVSFNKISAWQSKRQPYFIE